MKLIKEFVEEVEILKEETEDGVKNHYIQGIIMQGDIKNRNGRMYPSSVLVNEMHRYNDVYVKPRRAFGELGHPDGPTINLDRVSHIFTELKQDGSNIIGKAKVMDTPMGKIVKNLIDEGAQLGISSRGMGSLKRSDKGYVEVQEDFMLATAGDIVADPSGPNCYIEGIMESVDWVYNESLGWKAMEVVEEHKEIIEKEYKKLSEQKVFEMFNKFLKSIN